MLLHLRQHLVDLRDLPRMLGCRVGVPTIADEDTFGPGEIITTARAQVLPSDRFAASPNLPSSS
jgi:hypothetical protein